MHASNFVCFQVISFSMSDIDSKQNVPDIGETVNAGALMHYKIIVSQAF